MQDNFKLPAEEVSRSMPPPTTRNREWVPSDGAPLPTPSPMEIWVQFFFGYDSGSVLSDLMNRTVFSVFSAGLSRDHIILTAFA
jgi:hypothetical protein